MVQLDLNKSARHSCSIPGKVVASVSIDKNTYCHGEDIPITVKVDNGTSKMVKSVRVRIVFCNFPGFSEVERVGVHLVFIISGKVVVEASLDKEVFYHGEDIPLHISINNQSKKQAKSIMVR